MDAVDKEEVSADGDDRLDVGGDGDAADNDADGRAGVVGADAVRGVGVAKLLLVGVGDVDDGGCCTLLLFSIRVTPGILVSFRSFMRLPAPGPELLPKIGARSKIMTRSATEPP